MLFHKVHIIINPISGGKEKHEIGDVIQSNVKSSCPNSQVFFTAGRGDAELLAKNALSVSCDMVIAVGGDGTINEIASVLVNSDITLAVIPMGSGNGFARSLEIPLDISGSCDVICSGLERRIDVGKVNNRYFFLLAGVGFDAVVGRAFDKHSHRGPLPYFYLSAKEFINYQSEEYLVSVNGSQRKLSPFQITVANGRQYGNNAFIAPKAVMNDGLLNVTIFHSLPFHRLFTQLPKMFLGNLESVPDTEFFTSKSIKIKRALNGLINVDGEVIDTHPDLEFSIVPSALKLLTPTNSKCFI